MGKRSQLAPGTGWDGGAGEQLAQGSILPLQVQTPGLFCCSGERGKGQSWAELAARDTAAAWAKPRTVTPPLARPLLSQVLLELSSVCEEAEEGLPPCPEGGHILRAN